MVSSTYVGEFDYGRFKSLMAADLVAYMEPFLAGDPGLLVNPRWLDEMASELDTFDEYHLVYAIELGLDRIPQLFDIPCARFLAHERQSVRLAAHRGLSRLPVDLISEKLIRTCAQAVANRNEGDVADIVDLLRHKQTQQQTS